jgi:hypothetical protein
MKHSLLAAFCLLVTLDVGGAFAQSSQPLDILGVQLGMPRESAVRLLLSKHPPYSVTNPQTVTVEDLGTFVWNTSLKIPPPDYDTIDLDFALPPSKSTVLRIYRSVSYEDFSKNIPKTKPNAPTVETFVRSLAEKFRSPTPTLVAVSSANPGAVNLVHYVWTRAGEFLSSAELNRRLRPAAAYACINDAQFTPRRLADSNGGYDFHFHVEDKNFEEICGTVASVGWSQESGIITHFEMTLFDSAGLVLSFTKSAATIDVKKGIQKQQELQRAKQNRPPL